MTWIPREVEGPLGKAAIRRPALLLTGARQAGKTSLLRRVFPDHRYVSLDLPALAEEAETAGLHFLRKHPPPVIIDEVQYAPKLFRYLKHAIDSEHRAKGGMFLLTGSQKFSLMQDVSESLAGRLSLFELLPLSVRELEGHSKLRAEGARLLRWIFSGGYPELHEKGLDPERFYADYVATYLERDVRQAIQVRSLRDFDRLLRACAIRCGQLVSLSALAADIGVSVNTVKGWLSVLEASNVVVLVPPFSRNLRKRLIKTPKLYFADTGLACFLAGFRSPSDLEHSPMLGALFETHVLGQMLRYFSNRGRPAPIYFYRDHHGHEVDFVLPVGKRVKLIECKWTEDPAGPFRAFEEVSRQLGKTAVLSQDVVTPARGDRPSRTPAVHIRDSVDLEFLD